MARRIERYDDLQRLHLRAAAPYGEWADRALFVEGVWKADFGTGAPVADSTLAITRPSQARNIQSKLERMLAVRSTLKIRCVPANDTQKEIEKAEKRERALRAFLWLHRDKRQTDVFREGTFFTLHRGRGDWLVQYKPEADDLRVRITVPDSLLTYPVWTEDGIRYFTAERWMGRDELHAYLDGLTGEQKARMVVPDLRRLDDDGVDVSGPFDTFRVVEYWDDEIYAWAIDHTLVEVVEHDYGFMPLTEARFNRTPLNDQRWAAQGVLWPVADDLVQVAKLMSKAASAVELFYYPMLMYKSQTGEIITVDSRYEGEWEPVDESFTPVVLNPEPNHELLERLMQQFNQNIAHGTISPVVFNTDLPNASGFMVNQILSLVKDDLIDYQDALEWAFSRVLSNVLRLWEKYAGEQPGGGWELPMAGENTGRRTMETLKAEDIDGNYRVEVSVKVDLPQDIMQKITVFNQALQSDQDGMPRWDWESAAIMAGLDDTLEDLHAVKRRREFEYLLRNDPETQALYLARLRAEYLPELEDYRKQVEKADRQLAKREEAREARAIEQGLSEDVILPAEIAGDPQALTQFALLVEQGLTPAGALEQVLGGGPPLGVPGQQSAMPEGAVADPELQLLISALGKGGPGMGNLAGGLPDGFTGYDNGIATSSLPPAMQGAQPRRVMDGARVQVENEDDLAMRGGLPPRR